MNWIVSPPDLLGGKPCVRGTRLSVELILELLASGSTRQEILAAYPQLTKRAWQRPSATRPSWLAATWWSTSPRIDEHIEQAPWRRRVTRLSHKIY